MMTAEEIRRRLAQEAREYLADLRNLVESLKTVEGWIALGMVLGSVVVLLWWFVTALGFNPANEHVAMFMYKLGQRPCRPLSNVNGVIVFVDLVLLVLLAVFSVGNVFQMINRLRQGQPREPRDLIVTASMTVVAGVGGIVFMKVIC